MLDLGNADLGYRSVAVDSARIDEVRQLLPCTQHARFRIDPAPLRTYDPSSIESVQRIEFGPDGATGLAKRLGSAIDVHHRDHLRSRDRRGLGGITSTGTGDYMRLQARYGPHLTKGVAGETILLDAPEGLAGLPLPACTLHGADGLVLLADVRVPDPCVEFSRFSLGQRTSVEVDDAVRKALIDLDDGARGYRAMAGGLGRLALGDEVEIEKFADESRIT